MPVLQRLSATCVAAVTLLLSAGCPAPALESPDASADPCPPGLRLASDGATCIPLLPASDCPPGTMPTLGSETCAAVGWTRCPAGFEADPSGWGCRDVLPATACSGPTREAIGSPVCQAVGDCAAPFPPPEATLFVDATLPPSAVNATHFTRITDALAAARAGATIAVEAGNYAESLNLSKPVTLVGRCAERVSLENPTGANPGLSVGGGRSANVRGFTIRGQLIGAVVETGGRLVATDCVFEANREIGLMVAGADSRAGLAGSVVRATRPNAQGNYGAGVYLEGGGALALVDSALVGNRFAGVVTSDPGATAVPAFISLRRSVVRDTLSAANTGSFGIGLMLDSPALAELTDSVLAGNQSGGVLLRNAQARLTASDTLIRDTRANDHGQFGFGLQVQRGAHATLDHSAIVTSTTAGLSIDSAAASTPSVATLSSSLVRATRAPAGTPLGYGVTVQEGGRLELLDSAVVGNVQVNVLAIEQSSVTGRGSLIRDGLSNSRGGFGRGPSIQSGSRLELTGCAVVANRDTGLFLLDGATSALVVDSLVLGTLPQTVGPEFGLGIVVHSFAMLELTHSVSGRNFGIGLAVDGASANVGSSFIEDNRVAVHAQNGSFLVESSGAGALDPGEVRLSKDTVFAGNLARVGTGVVPLPGDATR